MIYIKSNDLMEVHITSPEKKILMFKFFFMALNLNLIDLKSINLRKVNKA